MDIKEFNKRLTEEFYSEIDRLTAVTPRSIRVLADISSILNCLWHPATQDYIKQHTPMSDTDMYAQAAIDAVRGIPGAESYLDQVDKHRGV